MDLRLKSYHDGHQACLPSPGPTFSSCKKQSSLLLTFFYASFSFFSRFTFWSYSSASCSTRSSISTSSPFFWSLINWRGKMSVRLNSRRSRYPRARGSCVMISGTFMMSLRLSLLKPRCRRVHLAIEVTQIRFSARRTTLRPGALLSGSGVDSFGGGRHGWLSLEK